MKAPKKNAVSKASVKLKDLKSKKNPKGGGGLLKASDWVTSSPQAGWVTGSQIKFTET